MALDSIRHGHAVGTEGSQAAARRAAAVLVGGLAVVVCEAGTAVAPGTRGTSADDLGHFFLLPR
jgi:hypothetical protein